MAERKYWDDYQKSYEEAIFKTGTKHAPWYIIPSNHKWYARLVVSEAIIDTLESLNLKYPEVTQAQIASLEECKKALLEE